MTADLNVPKLDLSVVKSIIGSQSARQVPCAKKQRFKVINGMTIDSTMATGNPLAIRTERIDRDKSRFQTSANNIGIYATQNFQFQENKFAPKNCNEVLRFSAYFQEYVQESEQEHMRVRKTTLLYYLKDGTIEIIEPKQTNSGLPQGTFLKRVHVQKPDGNNYSWKDLFVGMDFVAFGRHFKLYDCDLHTRKYYNSNNMDQSSALDVPATSFDQTLATSIQKPGAYYGKKNSALKTFMEAKLGNTKISSTKQFLQNNGKILCFECEYDATSRLYGELMSYTLNYFLEDDTVEIKEKLVGNSGRDPFPLMLSRTKLLKKWTDALYDEQNRGVEEPTNPENYYSARDLYVGAKIDVFNRTLKIVDADPFTRNYYQSQWNITLSDPVYTPVAKPVVPKCDPPPYTGFGTEEDSLGSCNALVPKVPKKDFTKMEKYEHMVLRFSARLISNRREQKNRKFIVMYHPTDDTIAIYEPTQRNTGIVGGKFLERGQHKRSDGKAYCIQDFALGERVVFNAHTFEMLEPDEFTKKFLENHNL